MDNKTEYNEEYFNKISLHKFEEKFKELGIGEVWKNKGKKDTKKILIKKALEILKTLHKAPENIEEKVVENIIIKNVVQEKPLVKTTLSKKVIENNLKIIEANLKNNIPSQKASLIKKREELLKMLLKEE